MMSARFWLIWLAEVNPIGTRLNDSSSSFVALPSEMPFTVRRCFLGAKAIDSTVKNPASFSALISLVEMPLPWKYRLIRLATVL